MTKCYASSYLIEESLKSGLSTLSSAGAVVVRTGKYTGRAAKDKYIVCDDLSEKLIEWGAVNQPIQSGVFEKLKKKVCDYLNNTKSYTEELLVGADLDYSLPLVVKTEFAHQALFAQTMFRKRSAVQQNSEAPFSIYVAPSVKANPVEDGTRGEAFIAINFTSREIVIGGTGYSGEIKKSVFTVMNFLLPQKNVLTMHAAANMDNKGKTAIFFGLSGTGKTSLSADASRKLIGDDEHGWCDTGVFNIEGGCYAKAIRLSPKSEPEIWDACHAYGTLLENVVMNSESREIDFDDGSLTENTRAAYSLEKIINHEASGRGGHPSAVIMLACDAFGVLPPVAKLNYDQAMYYFLSGYTAKVAGTEAGVTEPVSTFSACFGEPFMALSPIVYAKLLAEKLKRHSVSCYLINTGWWKGPYGVGERMPISLSRALVNAAVSGELAEAKMVVDKNFGFEVPVEVRGVPAEYLDIRKTWKDTASYDQQAKKLAKMFIENFDKRFVNIMDSSLAKAGPKNI